MRLCEWRLSSDSTSFAYGGDEVELSLWDTEKAFSRPQEAAPQNASTETKKRKRSDQLLPGELWRAKNVRVVCAVSSAMMSYRTVGTERPSQPTPTGVQYGPYIPTTLNFCVSTTSAHWNSKWRHPEI